MLCYCVTMSDCGLFLYFFLAQVTLVIIVAMLMRRLSQRSDRELERGLCWREVDVREVDNGRICCSPFCVWVRHMPLRCWSGGHIKVSSSHFWGIFMCYWFLYWGVFYSLPKEYTHITTDYFCIKNVVSAVKPNSPIGVYFYLSFWCPREKLQSLEKGRVLV